MSRLLLRPSARKGWVSSYGSPWVITEDEAAGDILGNSQLIKQMGNPCPNGAVWDDQDADFGEGGVLNIDLLRPYWINGVRLRAGTDDSGGSTSLSVFASNSLGGTDAGLDVVVVTGAAGLYSLDARHIWNPVLFPYYGRYVRIDAQAGFFLSAGKLWLSEVQLHLG